MDLADEIHMRVSGATRFILDSKAYSKLSKTFNKIYNADDLLKELKKEKEL